MNYFEWVPSYIQKLDREEFGERDSLMVSEEVIASRSDPEYARAINLVASDPRMEKPWKAIKGRLSEDHADEQLRNLVETISKGLKEPSKFWDLTPMSERDKELERVVSTIKKLSKLLKPIELKPRTFNIYCEVWREGQDENYDMREYDHTDTETHLKELQRHIEDLVGTKSYLVQAPSKNSTLTAEELYFIRRLYKYFMDQFNTPLDETVITMVEIFFEEFDITRDDIKMKRKPGSFPSEEENERREGHLEWHDDVYAALFKDK
ncbi:MAG: hypothetical protein COB36_10030 [Alphaproteobacteria bacterium]|nr:MAG: hypothetical protein COB36_10030 [Alphaproteobacteria bacterium]